ncbi:MAG: hypothetical protein Q9227_002228 [Pyrenula ochraceoflavens]
MALKTLFPRQGSEKAPVLLKYRSSRWFILVSVSMAIFTDVFLYAAVVPVLPFALHVRTGIESDKALWGYFSDRITYRTTPFLVGLIVLAGATTLLCVGSSIAVLILGRALQGISAALVWTVGLALLVETFDSKKVGMAMGYVGLAMSLAILTAPLLAGVVYSTGGYYPVFGMLFGLIAVDVLLRVLMVERKVAERWMDFSQPRCSEANEAAITDTTVASVPAEGPSHEPKELPATNPSENPTSDASNHNTRSRVPPVILLLKSPRLVAALFASLITALLTTSFDSTLPLFVKSLFNWTSLGAGLIFLPFVIPTFLGPIIGALSDRFGPKIPTATGFALAVPFLVCLRFVTHNDIGQKVLLCVLLAGIGFAMSLVFGPTMAEITWVVEAEERRLPSGTLGPRGPYAQAYSLFNIAFAGGTLIGPIFGGMVKTNSGWSAVGWSLAILSFVATIVSLLGVGEPLRKRPWLV